MLLNTAEDDTLKTVYAYGQQIRVPKWANYLAADSDKDVYIYENKPVCSENGNWWDVTDGQYDNFTTVLSWDGYNSKSSLILLVEVVD